MVHDAEQQTGNRESLWCQLCRDWWHRRLALRQLPVPPVTAKLAGVNLVKKPWSTSQWSHGVIMISFYVKKPSLRVINPLWAECFYKTQNIFTFSISSWHWDTGSWNSSSSKTRNLWSFTVNTVVVDGLVSQGARAATAAAMDWHIPRSIDAERVNYRRVSVMWTGFWVIASCLLKLSFYSHDKASCHQLSRNLLRDET